MQKMEVENMIAGICWIQPSERERERESEMNGEKWSEEGGEHKDRWELYI